ncbi:MAG: class I SAM-dependent methyltransferase [Alphaproteobacteria bacterium]|jgi:2-polyprenyl-3-methyl-5-hydroxy-6-metoxy-1,4-benzoquinol methylase|nr:class I SAM-dependent methyltransferase [Alphaproteobacteria bacterium]
MNSKKTVLTVKDHSVSGEEFQLLYNEELEMLETFPQPHGEKLSEYYKSEDYISHTDAKRNLFERSYHIIRSIALCKKVKLINSFSDSSKKLLDIGCGTGDFLQEAKSKGWCVKGVEPNKDARAIANSKTNNEVFDVDELLSFKENSFDVITLWHVLEHLPELDEQLDIFKKLLRPNGALIIAVPNHKSFDASYYKSFWAAYDVPRHLWHFSQASIKNLFQTRKMEVVKTLPMKFDSYYVSLLSEKHKTGKMNFIKAFLIGLRSNFKAKSSGEYSSLIYVVKNK